MDGWEVGKELGKMGIKELEKTGRKAFASYTGLEEKVSVLKSKIEELSDQKLDFETELHEAENNGNKRKREAEVWLENVQKKSNEVHDIVNGLGESSWWRRFDLGNRVEKALKEVASLQEKRQAIGAPVFGFMSNANRPFPTTRISGASAAETLEKIWYSLEDPEAGSIGVYGMGGIGKTIIMKHIHNRLIERKCFGDVFWVTVSEALDLRMLQGKVAKAVGLDLSKDEDEEERSRKIFNTLMSRERFVLILDDVCEAFSLDRIGIPELNSASGCKLLFTTRDLRVCHILESQKPIKVDLLSEDEAWDLFKKQIGGDTMLSPNVQDIAKHVAKECGRLPLAIVTVGQDLRRQTDEKVWQNSLRQLKCMTEKVKYMEDHILLRLRASYDRLRNRELQDHFLYCCLYPQDHPIPNKEVIDYWIWDGLLNELDNKEDEINAGHSILNELQHAFMLESGPFEPKVECVMMHNLIRRMAIGITRATQQFMVKAGVGLKESPSKEEWVEGIVRISLMGNKIELLPHKHKCPKLSTLLLQNNNSLRNISPSFFLHLQCLRVLNLSHTMIESLPYSISALVNLRALLLKSCSKLNKLVPLTNLKELRVLDISLTSIDELPRGLEELVKLRRLDLSGTSKLRIIQTGLMSKLSNLEDLEMYGTGWRWSSDSITMRGGAVIEEVANLKRLVNLSLHFVNMASLTNYVKSQKWRQLKGFALAVGPTVESNTRPQSLDFLVELADCCLCNQEASLVIPDKTQHLWIRKCHLIRLSDLMTNENVLSSIEQLDLCGIHHGTLANLRFLYIESCHNLMTLFSLRLLQQLTKLEEVRVQCCCLVKEMVAKEEDVEANIISHNFSTTREMTVTFSCLKLLVLANLPELESIGGESVSCNSLTHLEISNCPKLKKLPFNSLSSDLKGEIKGSREWWHALKWDASSEKTLLQGLFKEDTA